MPESTGEESRMLLLQYRRLLFSRYRALRKGSLDEALALNSEISGVESALLHLKHISASQKRLLDQCEFWIDQGEQALHHLRRQSEGMLFRERADIEIKKILQSIFPDEV